MAKAEDWIDTVHSFFTVHTILVKLTPTQAVRAYELALSILTGLAMYLTMEQTRLVGDQECAWPRRG